MDYHEYLLTDDWKHRRDWIKSFWGHRCVLCYSMEDIQVHHRTYERLGREEMTDCVPLCSECHTKHHDKLGVASAPVMRYDLIVTINP